MQSHLSWRTLPPAKQLALAGKLDGLYNYETTEVAFGNLSVDKQQALLLLLKQFLHLQIWDHVRRIENVYGIGGVGMNFIAWPSFLETIGWHKEFSRRFAKRPGNDGGFRERRVRFGGLHILYKGTGEARKWDAHFDMYNPLFSPANTARHVWNEVIKSHAPNWEMVRGWQQRRK
jgi:hypothetical protein